MSKQFVQDFEPVIFNKKSKRQNNNNQNNQNNSKPERKYYAGKNKQNKSDVNIRKLENEEIKLPTISLEMRKLIQQTRNNKKWTQEDLARNCGLPKEVIRDYENGKAIVKQSELSKINKALGLNLKKPRPVKMNND